MSGHVSFSRYQSDSRVESLFVTCMVINLYTHLDLPLLYGKSISLIVCAVTNQRSSYFIAVHTFAYYKSNTCSRSVITNWLYISICTFGRVLGVP